ncbi:MAG: repeat-containing protein, partial [Armatimonadetes bacterium]|nr:repeat-containing protein [Armatimonadota bacterium]
MISTCFRRTCCLLLLLLCLCTAGALAATPGALDPAFGVNGIVRTDLRDNDEQGAAVCKLPDGRFVVAGTSFVAAGTGDFALVRYFPDGSVDPSFGTGGFVLTDFVGRLDSASAIERLSDGRLIVAGYAIGNDGNRHVAFAQYLADGTLNSGFGAGGKLLGPVGFVSSLLVQPDGKLVVALKDGPDFIAHRYLPDGAQDAGFGNGGVATLNVYPGRTDISTASVLQPDGKILMAGTASTPSGAQLALGRLLSNGSPDPSFGTVGVTTYSFPSASSTLGNAVAVQPDGRILVAGTGLFPANQHFFMMRCQADGAPDGSFGTSGLAVTDFLAGDDAINTILLQPDGKIVAAGPCASELGGSFWDFGVARYLPDGTPDFQFGSFGKVRTDFGTGQRDEPFDLFVDDQAGLVAVGTVTSGVPGEGTIGLARYFLGNFWPVARDDAATTPEDTPLELSASLDPLANDTDANGDPLQLVLLAQPVHGEVTEAAGAWRYVPDPDFSGVDSFTYRPSDGQDQGKPATVRITVTAVNDAPVAQNDAYDLNEDAALTVAAPGVLSNDSDVDSGTLTAALVTAPASGVATISSTGRLTYTPLPNFSGLDTLQYRVSDAAALSNVATVSVTVHPVNDAPVVSAQSVTVDEDQTAAITLSGIDPDADPLSFSLVSVPLHGSLTGTPPNLIYRPSPNYFGPDSFTFRASDGNFQTGSALVAITVGPVNDSPTALPDNYTGVEDQALVVPPASGVLANDSDT